jgi:hypothetical protein
MTDRWHKEIHKILFENGGGGRGVENIIQQVNFFNVHCTHLCNYHNENKCMLTKNDQKTLIGPI